MKNKRGFRRAVLALLAVVATVGCNVSASTALGATSGVAPTKKTLKLSDEKNLTLVEPTSVSGYGNGFVEAEDGVCVCDAGAATDKTFGVVRRYVLNQTKATPIVATGWSKAEGVGGNSGFDYSLYIDAELADGTMIWGETANFKVGDADWSQGRIEFLPKSPIKSLVLYGLFRNRSGKASFKEIQLFEANIPDGFATFDGVPVAIRPETIVGVPLGGAAYLRDVAQSGDFVGVDVEKARSEGGVEVDGIRIEQEEGEMTASTDSGARFFTLTNLSDEDRALTFVISTPADAFFFGRPWRKDIKGIPPKTSGSADDDWYWLDDPRRVRKIEGSGEYFNTKTVPEVGSGRLSAYPIGGIADGETGSSRGFAVDPNFPAFYRIGYSAASRELYLAFDVALTAEKPTAEFRYRELWDGPTQAGTVDEAAPAEGAFRELWSQYVRLFPESFVVRTPKQGNWMPFAKISAVPNFEDFGFQFKEGIDEPGWDDKHGIASFRYTEPMTWWQSLPADAPKTIESATATVEKLAAEGDRNARALLASGFRDAKGRLCGQFLDTPWCVGVVWSVNDAPGLVDLAKSGKLANGAKDENGAFYPGGFELKWSREIADGLYPAEPAPSKSEASAPRNPFSRRSAAEEREEREKFAAAEAAPGVDGEYVDSSEGYVTAILDFERSHFAGMATPLVFDAKTKRPAIYRGLVAFEYVKKIADDVHRRGKLAMANSTPGQFFWLVPQLDVLGTETNWNWNGKWTPASDADSLYRRTLCGGKPYCYLMNTDFGKFSNEMVEKYMKRALAYGMFPGFFSADASTGHYFSNPELFERDRALFKKYLPLCKAVAEAGWNPITRARSNDAKIYVEAFGGYVVGNSEVYRFQGDDYRTLTAKIGPEYPAYFTVFNDSDEEKSFEITFDKPIAEFIAENGATELTSGEVVAGPDGKIVGKIDPEDVRVFILK